MDKKGMTRKELHRETLRVAREGDVSTQSRPSWSLQQLGAELDAVNLRVNVRADQLKARSRTNLILSDSGFDGDWVMFRHNTPSGADEMQELLTQSLRDLSLRLPQLFQSQDQAVRAGDRASSLLTLLGMFRKEEPLSDGTLLGRDELLDLITQHLTGEAYLGAQSAREARPNSDTIHGIQRWLARKGRSDGGSD